MLSVAAMLRAEPALRDALLRAGMDTVQRIAGSGAVPAPVSTPIRVPAPGHDAASDAPAIRINRGLQGVGRSQLDALDVAHTAARELSAGRRAE